MRCAVCNLDNLDGATSCRSCGSPLDAGAPTVQEQVLPAGTVLQGGAFVLEGVLGQGGFGITYKSRDAKLTRMVAIKEFSPRNRAACAGEPRCTQAVESRLRSSTRSEASSWRKASSLPSFSIQIS